MTTKHRKNSFADWVALVRSLEGRHWEDGGLVGTLKVASSEQAEFLKVLFRDAATLDPDMPCQVQQGDPDLVQIGDLFCINLQRPRLGFGYLFKDAAEWLRNRDVQCGRLQRWYIADLDWLAGETGSDLAAPYKALLNFISVLEKSAAVVDKSEGVIVFLPGERFDVPVRYVPSDLQSLDIESLQELVTLVEIQDGHTKQRLEILGRAVCDMSKDVPPESRFGHMIQNLPDLLQRMKDGYSLFASSFSFEKVRDQMEALRVDYTSRIHKALSDIQGQLLGIPVSTIVVATQMKTAQAPGAEMWGNVAILVGAAIFVALLFLAVRNQSHTLDVLETELERQENQTKLDQPDIANRFATVFSSLHERITHQRWILRGVVGVCLLGFFLGFTMFWAMTKPALSVFF